jgi:hypothetical protein
MSSFILPSFSEDTPNKISNNNIIVCGKHTLIKTEVDFGNRVAIADEPIDAKVGGKKMFCVLVDKSREDTPSNPYSEDTEPSALIMIGFSPMETFDSTKDAWFGENGFTGCGIELSSGRLVYRGSNDHSIINYEISRNATEIIVILTISNNGKKKEIKFLCDGKESKSADVSKHLQGDRVFSAIVLWEKNQQVTTIPIDEVKIRTPEIENLIKEYQQQNNKNNNQSGGAVASSSSSATIQLQKELDEALQKIATLSSQLQQEKQKSSDLEKEVQQLKQQLSSS